MAKNVQLHAIDFLLESAATTADDGAPDSELLRMIATTSCEQAFNTVVNRYGRALGNTCRRYAWPNEHDAEDLFQATLLVLKENASSIKISLPAWLSGVAWNLHCKANREEGNRWCREKDCREVADPKPDALSQLISLDTSAAVIEVVGQLPEKFRWPVVLYHFMDKSYSEAARLLGCPEGTFAGRIGKGREMLRTRLLLRGLTLTSAAVVAAMTEQAIAKPTLTATQPESDTTATGIESISATSGGLLRALKSLLRIGIGIGQVLMVFFWVISMMWFLVGSTAECSGAEADPTCFMGDVGDSVVVVSDATPTFDDQEGWLPGRLMQSRDPGVGYLVVGDSKSFIELDRPILAKSTVYPVYVRRSYDESGRLFREEVRLRRSHGKLVQRPTASGVCVNVATSPERLVFAIAPEQLPVRPDRRL